MPNRLTARWRDATSRLLALAERHLPALTRLRQAESLPIVLTRRRIYVLPSGFGVAFAVLIFVMLIGALNYANNPALLLTSILAAAAWISVFAGFRTLAGLRLIAVDAAPCHAGEMLELRLRFDPQSRSRQSLRLRCDGAISMFSLAGGDSEAVLLPLPTTRRGWLRPGRLKLWTEQPLGLFVVWSWLNPQPALLIYATAEHPPPALPLGGGAHGEQPGSGSDEDFAGLREYRRGDPPRHIAWKMSARHEQLLSRETERQAGPQLVLDYAQLGSLDHEARIRRLTAWVMAADNAARPFRLQLPREQIGPGVGHTHRHACLRALALLPHASD
ncbi:MAG: DUF58 domain-containing protein [Dokdonella sp.]